MPDPGMENGAGEPPAARCGGSAAAVPTYAGRVLPEWADANGHMNVSFYDRVFDEAERALFASVGIHDDYIRRTGFSVFRLDKLIRYERELMVADVIAVKSRVLWTDLRRVHAFHELWNVEASYRAATKDALSIHVDLSRRRSAIVALPEVRMSLEALATAQAAPPVPAGAVPRDAFWRARS